MAGAVSRRHGARRVSVCALAAAGVALVAGCGSSGHDGHDPAPQAAPAALHAAGAPDGLHVGVVVTLTSAPGQGSDWSRASEGAQVAAFRYGLGGTKVTVTAVNDKGTAAGARAAVSQLVDDHVSGIVFATAGSHVEAGLAAAQSAGLPSVLPYPTDVSLPDDAWSIAPDDQQVGAGLAKELSGLGANDPLLIDAGGPVPTGLDTPHTLHYRSGTGVNRLANKVVKLHRRDGVDALVIAGDAVSEATITAAIQGTGTDLPTLLTPAALSPNFAIALASADGSLDAPFDSVGVPSPDTTAMTEGTAGDAASAYLAAVRTAANSPTLQDYFDGQPFASVAAEADQGSHDAVIALVSAAAKAKSDDPSKVLAALRNLSLTPADGLAGPPLDFRHQQAMGDRDVVPLQSTAQNPGLLPATNQPHLFWFAAPDK